MSLFITLPGQATFAKLKTLGSPTTVRELTLDQKIEHLMSTTNRKLLSLPK